MGVNRHIVVAETEAAAQRHRAARLSRRGGTTWGSSGTNTTCRSRSKPSLPPDFETVLQARRRDRRHARDQVRDFIAHEIEATGVNYYVCDFAFGTISHDEAMRSVELFAKEVMPAFA